jgi:hypothetical protein
LSELTVAAIFFQEPQDKARGLAAFLQEAWRIQELHPEENHLEASGP